MYLSIHGMRVIYSAKNRYAIRLKFVEKFSTFLTKLVLEASIKEITIKENSLLYCRTFFGICYRCHNLTYFYNKTCITTKQIVGALTFWTSSKVTKGHHTILLFLGNDTKKWFLTNWDQDNNIQGVHEDSNFWKNFTVRWARLWTTSKYSFIEC